MPSALSLLALSVCILVAALLFGVAAPPAQAAVPGGIAGTVTVTGGAPAYATVWLFTNTGGGWSYNQQTTTDPDGGYYFAGLQATSAAMSYRIGFYDYSGTNVTQYYDNKPTLESATDVAVTAGVMTPGIDATLVAFGHISGTVRNASGAGLGGITVAAYRSNGSGSWDWEWDWVSNTSTAADGTYDLGGLDTGSYRIGFHDPYSGTYITQYYNKKSTLSSANNVAVSAGTTRSGINATLAAFGHISGTVRNGSGVALGNIYVYAYRLNASGGWDSVIGAGTAADGVYDLGGLRAGSYRVMFYDVSGAYITHYYNKKWTLSSANDVAVIAGATTGGINATFTRPGHITGTVRNPSDAALGGITVTAYRSDGSGGWDEVSNTWTDIDGRYDLGGLRAGSYRIEFLDDSSGRYVTQYYDNKSNLDVASDVAVTADATTGGIDATLTRPGHISGTVTNASAAGLESIYVTAYRSDGSGGWDSVSSASTAADGAYDLGGLDTGSYRIEFFDYSGTYLTQYYDNKSNLDVAGDVAVTADATTSGINATLVAAAAFDAISVSAPTGSGSQAQGSALPVTWSANAAVATGQFSIWVVSPANGWYVGKIVPADGDSADYSDTVDLNVPVASGYRVYVFYRATGGDPWGIYGSSPGTVDVTATFNAISVSAPSGSGSLAQGDSLPVAWSVNQTVAAGQFSIWVVSPANGWYVGKIVPASGASLDYSDTVDLNVPVDSGYRVFVYYRPVAGSGAWGIYGMSPGTVDVSAATTFNAISVSEPAGPASFAQGDSLPVSWSAVNAAVATGQFSIWVVSPANGWYVGKIVDAHGDSADYSDSVDLNVPAGSGYQVYVFYRATSGDPWDIYGISPGTVDVTGPFSAISVSTPTGSGSQAQGSALTVDWRANVAVDVGEFSIWLVSPANGWYVGQIVPASGASADYSDSIDLNVPADTGYHVYVFYRAASGDPWDIYGMSPGTVDVTAPPVTVNSPNGGESWARLSTHNVTWTVSPAATSGYFRVLYYNPTRLGVYQYASADVPVVSGQASYSNPWTITELAGYDWWVRVYQYSSSGTLIALDNSNASFTIAAE